MADLAEVSQAQVQPVGAGGMELGSPASGKAMGDTLRWHRDALLAFELRIDRQIVDQLDPLQSRRSPPLPRQNRAGPG